MEGGLPMLNCLLQHTLRSLCACSDSSPPPSKWSYAVFWRIVPRNYPPPKWDHIHGGGLLDRAKGNKRNWILVWEDGFCDFHDCERGGNGCGRGRFGASIFFKMTHEVYNFGEGLVGKVASDNSHRWVFRDTPTEINDPTSISSWNASIDPQPRAWEAQFSSGIETIALISVREGAIQLGSFDKVVEDHSMVLNIQRKFSYLHSIPGIYSMHRPHQSPLLDYNGVLMQTLNAADGKHQMQEMEKQSYEQVNVSPAKSLYLAEEALSLWSIPPLFPSNASVSVPYYAPQGFGHHSILLNSNGVNLNNDAEGDGRVESFDVIGAADVKVETGEAKGDRAGEENDSPLRQAEFRI